MKSIILQLLGFKPELDMRLLLTEVPHARQHTQGSNPGVRCLDPWLALRIASVRLPVLQKYDVAAMTAT